MGSLDWAMYCRRPIRLCDDSHLHFRELVHRRQLQRLCRICNRGQDAAPFGNWGFCAAFREPDVPQHGLPMG